MAKNSIIKHIAMRVMTTLLCVFSLCLITSCLQDRAQKTVVASTGVSWFEGVFKVSNIGGIPANVKVEWNRSDRTVTAYRVYSLVENVETKQNEWTLIDEVNSETLVYNHSNLISGRIYSYRVKAVGTDDVEDTNTKQLSTVVFEGIGGVRVTGKTTATVSLNSSLGAFDEIRIYATPKRTGGVKKIVATAKGNVQNVNVTGLRSGTAYKFSASAFISYLNTEDGNEYTKEDQTYSESFGSGVANDNDFAYRGVLSVQAFGLAPNAEVGPSDRLIKLTWLPFLNSSAQTKYRVIRVAGSGLLDTTTTKVCTAIMDVSCIACEVTGAGFQHCDDTQLAPPPKRYDYVVTMVRKDATTGDEWVEELPTTNKNDFRISAHVPPEYMVLVQRDAANFEMCSQLGQSSNPRKKQRCLYSGMGATPYNSGPGKSPMILDPNYYDFGYNLFVDRYKLACNWTRQSDGGNCGAGASPGDCVGITHNTPTSPAPPSDTLGTPGNVFFAVNATYGHNCYIKVGSTWKESKLNTLTPAERLSATTIDPGPLGKKHRPVIQNMAPVDAFNLCQAHTTSYGAKRLMRRREHFIMAAQAALEGEPNAVTDTRSRYSIQRGSVGISNFECGGNYGNVATRPTTINELIDPTNTRGQVFAGGNYAPYYASMYFIGTQSTKNCITRWGNQDYNGYDTIDTWLSDSFVRTSVAPSDPLVLQGDVSDFDNGSRDFAGFRVDGALGQNYGKTSTGATSYEIYPTHPQPPGNSYILPLGMPIVNWTGPTQTLIPILELFNRSFFGYRNISGGGNDVIRFDSNNATRFYMSAGYFGRTSFSYGYDTASGAAKVLCAVEAE